MPAAKYNMLVNQGEDYSLRLLFKDENGNPINVSTSTFEGQIREKYDSSSIVASFSFVLGPATNEVFAKMSNVVTAAINCTPATNSNRRPLTEFIYDIEQTVSGVKTRILEGIVTVSPNVTR